MVAFTRYVILFPASVGAFVGLMVGAVVWGFKGGRKTATELLDETLAEFRKRA